MYRPFISTKYIIPYHHRKSNTIPRFYAIFNFDSTGIKVPLKKKRAKKQAPQLHNLIQFP